MFDLRPLYREHIEDINAVISAAVNAWPMAERVRRLSLPLLQYDAEDIRHYNLNGCFVASRALIGVVAWDNQCVHGLYVQPDYQGQGIGRTLLAVAAQTIRRDAPPLTLRAQRVSAPFFEHVGLSPSRDPSDYPYTFMLTGDFSSRGIQSTCQ